MPVLIEQRSFIAHAPEPSSDTMTRGTPFDVTLSGWASNNAVNGTELTGAIDDYIGNFLEFLDGNIAGEWSRIREFAIAANTVTIDPVSNASPTATRARMWVPPEPLLPSTTTGGAATTIESSARTETTTTYWADPDRFYAVCEGAGGANAVARGEVQQITAFDGTNTFTTGAFTAIPSEGDLFVIRQPVKAASAEIELPELGYTFIERKFVKGTMDQDPGVQGPRTASASLAIEIKGNNTAASGATVALPPTEANDFLASILTEERDGASAIVGGTTTAPTITTGTWERFATASSPALTDVGDMVLISGEAAGITVMEDGGVGADTLTISPALTNTPVAAAVVLGGVNYKPRTASGAAWAAGSGGFRSHTLEAYMGNNLRVLLYGWHFDLEIEGLTNAEIPRFKFSGPADTHIRQDVAAPYTPTFETKLPWATKGSRVVLGGTTYSNVLAATFKVGYDIQPQFSVNGANGKNGHIVGNRKTTGSLRVWLENWNLGEFFEQAIERELLIQVGSTATNCVALWCPAIQISGVTISKEGGGYAYDLTFNVLRSNITGVSDFVITAF